MQISSTTYYISFFVIIFIVIFGLLIFAPSQNIFFNLKEECPYLYYILHQNKSKYDRIIKEIIKATNLKRPDIEEEFTNYKLEWIDYPNYNYVKKNIQILPLFYQNKYYNNINYFPELMTTITELCSSINVLNVFFWKFSSGAAFCEHNIIDENGNINTDEKNIIEHSKSQKVLRYTLAINPLTVMEDECSLWVDGKIKKLAFDDYVLWDPTKKFSLHNDTYSDSDVLFLNIDIVSNN